MRKRVIVRGPALSRSGYGEQTRFALRALRSREELFEIFLIVTGWGKTGWMYEIDEEREWMDRLVTKTANYQNQGGQYDISFQITIPNEWERLAPINIGYTAGIETTRIAPVWIEKANQMDKIVVVSNHAKYGFDETTYNARNEATGEIIQDFRCVVPTRTVNYPARYIKPVKIELDLETDFNFLTVAQWGVRKNLENTVKWFVEEFYDQEVGLVVKTNTLNNSVVDRHTTEKRMANLLKSTDTDGRKCKVYLIHGDMTEEEMTGLYTHSKIKALISLAHGEGFGLPIFEATQHALPVIATDWSGQCDFLYMPQKDKKGKVKNKAMFSKVEYDLAQVQPEAVWDNVLISESMWAFPKPAKAKIRMREMYKDYKRLKSRAKKLQKWVLENFAEEKQYEEMYQASVASYVASEDNWLNDIEDIVQSYA